jgi:ribosome biogenesis protein MAK21
MTHHQNNTSSQNTTKQESAVANVRSLDGLIALAAKRSGGRSVVGPAIEALQELFQGPLLPDGRKLRVFEQQPLAALPLRLLLGDDAPAAVVEAQRRAAEAAAAASAGRDDDAQQQNQLTLREAERCLIYWAAEDAIKRRYAQFLEALEQASRDPLTHLRERALRALHALLQAKPEGEQVLLQALVNKLGDPERRVASRAGYLLHQLLQQHPAMKVVVVREVSYGFFWVFFRVFFAGGRRRDRVPPFSSSLRPSTSTRMGISDRRAASVHAKSRGPRPVHSGRGRFAPRTPTFYSAPARFFSPRAGAGPTFGGMGRSFLFFFFSTSAHPPKKPQNQHQYKQVERFAFRPGLSPRALYYAAAFLNQLPLSRRPEHGGSELARRLVDLYFALFGLVLSGKIGRGAVELQKAQEQLEGKGKGPLKRKQLRRLRGGGTKGGGVSPHAALAAAAAAAAAAKRKEKQKKQQGGEGDGEGSGSEEDVEDNGNASTAAAPAGVDALASAVDARMLSALIAGVRRAFPYVGDGEAEALVERHSDPLFRLVHVAPFTVSLQALMLLYQLLSGGAGSGGAAGCSDRFYRALYGCMLSEGPRASGSAAQFMSLLHKAVAADPSPRRAAAFAKRLLQAALHAPASWAAGALVLLSELLAARPELWVAVQQPERLGSAGGGGVDADGNGRQQEDDDDDEEERFFDAPDDGEEEEKAAPAPPAAATQQQQQQRPSNHNSNVGALPPPPWPKPGGYDMKKREPLHAHAERSCWWELSALASHAHPSVAAFARTLLAGQPVVYAGDPLRDFTAPAFFDKFVSKPPKAHARGSSLMQPLPRAGGAVVGAAAAADAAALGGGQFALLAESEVDASELFFHRFYQARSANAERASRQAAKRAARRKKAGSDDEDEDDEEDASEDDDDGVGSDGALASDDEDEEEAADRVLSLAERGDEGDDDDGYDELAAAMRAAPSFEDVVGAAGGKKGGKKAAAEASSSSEEEEEDGSGSGSEEEEEEMASGSELQEDDEEEEDGSGDEDASASDASDAADDLASPDGDGLSDLSDSGTGDEGDFVMADAGALAADEEDDEDDAPAKKKKKKAKRGKAAPAAARVDGGDDEFDRLDVFDLPSPSSSFGDGAEEDDEEEEDGDAVEDDVSLDFSDLVSSDEGGSDDSAGEEGESDEEEDEDAGRKPKKAKRGGGGGGGDDWLAPADDYDDILREAEAAPGESRGLGSDDEDQEEEDERLRRSKRGGGRGGRGGGNKRVRRG